MAASALTPMNWSRSREARTTTHSCGMLIKSQKAECGPNRVIGLRSHSLSSLLPVIVGSGGLRTRARCHAFEGQCHRYARSGDRASTKIRRVLALINCRMSKPRAKTAAARHNLGRRPCGIIERISAASFSKSTGLTKCASKPALRARSMSSVVP